MNPLRKHKFHPNIRQYIKSITKFRIQNKRYNKQSQKHIDINKTLDHLSNKLDSSTVRNKNNLFIDNKFRECKRQFKKLNKDRNINNTIVQEIRSKIKNINDKLNLN